ncbi:sulfate permease [Propionibacterium freudenreichii]|uniref:sulfate permease n=1 Tax=Propionibacterium freudenreichii TaxID=1744 RepID=UPI0021A483EE|nr:sulfate permease [Propionibacterium freudenreichii]
MPTNILLDLIRTRQGLKWGIPAILLAIPYLLTASTCTTLLVKDGPGWLNLIVIWAIWNALKFIAMGPTSVLLLVRARLREYGQRRARREAIIAVVL